MTYYYTYGDFQAQMKDYYFRTGNRMQFPEMTDYLHRKGLLLEEPIAFHVPDDYESITDEEFDKVIDQFPLHLVPTNVTKTVVENDVIPNTRDVFVMRHPRYTRPYKHTHNYFEMNFVVKGSCTFTFDDETHIMHEGELCIIAPDSLHDILIEDDSIVFSISIRKSTFDTTFFSLMSRKDLLSNFFQTTLRNTQQKNYLMFFTGENIKIRHFTRELLVESHRNDMYCNTCCVSLINLLFAELLRTYSQTVKFYNYEMGSDFSLVLQYVQHNYQTLTLSFLAELFHYSEPHLCSLIKQNTGYTFTEMIKRLRLSDAVEYLINTDIKIGEIAERIGYNSADHFSRVFRSTYKMSPLEYRKQNKNDVSPFVPFSMNNPAAV